MDLKAKVVELLEKERAWQLGECKRFKFDEYSESPKAAYDAGAHEAYDECQNSLIHVIEEIKKL